MFYISLTICAANLFHLWQLWSLVIKDTVRLHMVTTIRSEAAKIARVTLLILVLCIDVIFQALSNLGSQSGQN